MYGTLLSSLTNLFGFWSGMEREREREREEIEKENIFEDVMAEKLQS